MFGMGTGGSTALRSPDDSDPRLSGFQMPGDLRSLPEHDSRTPSLSDICIQGKPAILNDLNLHELIEE